MSQNSTTFETLARLSARPGVQSTLVLSRADGAIIQSSGFSTEEKPSISKESGTDARTSTVQDGTTGAHEDEQMTADKEEKRPEEIARAVFSYVSEASKLISATGSKEEVQLLRLRTKSYEIVIVPDQRYLMIVMQDAPKVM